MRADTFGDMEPVHDLIRIYWAGLPPKFDTYGEFQDAAFELKRALQSVDPGTAPADVEQIRDRYKAIDDAFTEGTTPLDRLWPVAEELDRIVGHVPRAALDELREPFARALTHATQSAGALSELHALAAAVGADDLLLAIEVALGLHKRFEVSLDDSRTVRDAADTSPCDGN